VEQNDGAAVWLACGWNIHVGHAHVLAVERQRQVAHWIWIRNILVGDAAWLHISRSFGRVRSRDEGDEPAGENYEEVKTAVKETIWFCHGVRAKAFSGHDIRLQRRVEQGVILAFTEI